MFLIAHHCNTTVGMDFRQGVIVSMPKLGVKAFNCWCNILVRTVFHYPRRAKSKHLPPILYAPRVVQYMQKIVRFNPGAIQDWVFPFCTPHLCTGTWACTGMLHRLRGLHMFLFRMGPTARKIR